MVSMKTYRFYKDEIGWFIDLKWFPFNRGYLAMVAGADEVLNKLSNNGNEIFLSVSTKPKFGNLFVSSCLFRVEKLGLYKGAVYTPSSNLVLNYEIFEKNQLWLCAVTLLIFGHYPSKIYYKVENNG